MTTRRDNTTTNSFILNPFINSPVLPISLGYIFHFHPSSRSHLNRFYQITIKFSIRTINHRIEPSIINSNHQITKQYFIWISIIQHCSLFYSLAIQCFLFSVLRFYSSLLFFVSILRFYSSIRQYSTKCKCDVIVNVLSWRNLKWVWLKYYTVCM